MSLEDNLRKWIDSQGYPLEMQVAEALRAAGAFWDHGRVYEDPLTGKSREIDLIGSFGSGIQLIFECKHSTNKSWVLFCTDRHILSPVGQVLAHPTTDRQRQRLERVSGEEAVQALSLFVRPDLIGFNLVAAHGGNQDAAFQGVGTLMSSSAALAKRGSEFEHSILYLPVLVVDAPLFECWLPAAGGQYELRQVSCGSLVQPTGDGRRWIVRVVHVDALDSWLTQVEQDCQELVDLLESDQ